MRLVYVTSALPYGSREPFLIAEIDELLHSGVELIIVPMRPQGAVAHMDVKPFLDRTLARPLICGEIVCDAIAEARESPRRTLAALRLVLSTRSLRILLKNLGVFPKGIWLARRVRLAGADHLHAHWASTSSTMALVAAEISGIPWSLTAHRWDIPEDNLLAAKAAHACFLRTISRRGARAVAALAGADVDRIQVLHVGIRLPERPPPTPLRVEQPLRVVAVADFVEVKGHRYLLDALELLADRGVPVRVDLVGSGPLRPQLQRRIATGPLRGTVRLLGVISHARLLDDLRAHRWDAAVLPSIVTDDADEGIPVALMEAMASGLPVLSTRTGAIPELLDGGAGLLVAGGDAKAFADGLERLAGDSELRALLAVRGRRRVEREFDVVQIASTLVRSFAGCS